MAFWGVEVKPGKVSPFVPPPESSKLHLSQASLGISARKGVRCALKVKVGDGEPLVVCCLREGGSESLGLDLIFDSYTEFSVEGPASIHLTGYFMPEYELDGGHNHDDEDGELGGKIIGIDEYGIPIMAEEDGSEDDSDLESDEDDDEDEHLMLESGDEEEDSSEEEDDDDGLRQLGRRRTVVIEEIKDEEPGDAKPALKALPAPEAANGKAAEFGDEDVSASDEDGDEDEEGSEEEEEEEEEESEEEKAPAPAPQHAGQKRKAEAAPTPAKKQVVEDGKGGKQGKPAAAAAAQAPQPQQQPRPAVKQEQSSQQKPQRQQEQQQKSAAKQQQAAAAAKTPAKTPAKEENVAANELPSSNKKVRQFANGFEIEDVKQGRPDGKLAKPGKKVVVKYVGRLKSNGKIFDETKGNKTFTFRLGVGEVIKGWDKGVEGMRVGDKRKLSIPPQMAYGTQGVRNAIPPNAWLNFDVELVDVK